MDGRVWEVTPERDRGAIGPPGRHVRRGGRLRPASAADYGLLTASLTDFHKPPASVVLWTRTAIVLRSPRRSLPVTSIGKRLSQCLGHLTKAMLGHPCNKRSGCLRTAQFQRQVFSDQQPPGWISKVSVDEIPHFPWRVNACHRDTALDTFRGLDPDGGSRREIATHLIRDSVRRKKDAIRNCPPGLAGNYQVPCNVTIDPTF